MRFFLNETSNYSNWGKQPYHLMQKLVRKFSSQTAEFWQKYIQLKYRFCNKIQATLILYAAFPVVCIKFNFNHKVLSARLYKNKEFMKPVWVILTIHDIGINVVLCPLNWRPKDWFPIRSLLAGASACTEASGYQNFHLSPSIGVHQGIHRIQGWYCLTLYTVTMICR